MSLKKRTKKGAAPTASEGGSNAQLLAEGLNANRAPAHRAIRGRRGGLKDMPKMPLDILIEIFSCMHPRDLLNLARTSKEFRRFLMSRQSASFWRAARQQVDGLPECPQFLSEPQYANLLFFPHCHNCLKGSVRTVVWELYARYCPKCKDQLFVPESVARKFYEEVREATGTPSTVVGIPPTSNWMYYDGTILKKEYEKIEAKWQSLTTNEEKRLFAQERVNTIEERARLVKALRDWFLIQADSRHNELENVKKTRRTLVFKRLRDEGWGDEIDKMSLYSREQLGSHKLVWKAQKLTEYGATHLCAGWQTIRPVLVAVMQDVRAKRLQAERSVLVQERLLAFHQFYVGYEESLGLRTIVSETQAGFSDLALMPPFRALLDAPSATVVTSQDFEHLRDAIPAAQVERYREQELLFLAKACEAYQVPNEVTSLGLAIVSFACADCMRDLRWPNVLVHECSRGQEWSAEGYVSDVSLFATRVQRRGPWRTDSVPFAHGSRAEAARSIILTCGRNPDTVTYADMESCGVRLICLVCPAEQVSGLRRVYDWKHAIDHRSRDCSPEYYSGEAEWKVLDNRYAAKVCEMETIIAPHPLYQEIFCPTYCCARCRLNSRVLLQGHLQSAHGVSNPRLDQDYFVHPDSHYVERRTLKIKFDKKARKVHFLTTGNGSLAGPVQCWMPLCDAPAGEAEVAHGSSTSGNPRSNHARTRRNVRGRRGGLKDMPGMPLDILIEIFSLMHPRDLLNLARTSKEFRAFLMSRNSAPFWKAARQQVEGLPECPPFLSEPQYANLLFFPYCHSCLKSNMQTIIWELYARYCQACKDIMYAFPFNCGSFCLTYHTQALISRTSLCFGILFKMRYGRLCIHKPDFEIARAQWDTKTTNEEKVRFAKDQANAARERKMAIGPLEAWKTNQASNRATELEAIKQTRYEQIVKRLREEGWGEEIDKMTLDAAYDLTHHKAVRKAQKLTEGGWQSIKQDLLTHMERVREDRLESEREELIHTRLGFLCDIFTEYEDSLGHNTTPTELRAGFSDIAMMAPFRELVEAPSSQEVTPQDFRKLYRAIPDAMAAWYDNRESEFLDLIPDVIEMPDWTSLFELATVAFECRECDRTDMRWPAVLAHKCGRTFHYYLSDFYVSVVASVSMEHGVRGVWNPEGNVFQFSERRANLAREVIKACGLEPNVATHEEMDQCRARLVCMRCSPSAKGFRGAYDWTRAVRCLFCGMLVENDLSSRVSC
ncbi:hypothetical protein C8Q79DRAFT_910119 [Trametes meyenii]|nr:hypothetical protein C8Q79DRAFT_910119 [Trametes meyenii]